MELSQIQEFCVVYVTVPNDDVAFKITTALLNAKLAACVNKVSGVESSYWWKEKIESDKELLLIIKTRISLVDELTSVVKSNHTYTVPEVIALPLLTVGNQDYFKWIKENTKDPKISNI